MHIQAPKKALMTHTTSAHISTVSHYMKSTLA